MGKKLVVGIMLLFLLVMAGLSLRAASNPEHAVSGRGSSTVGVIEVNGVIGGYSDLLGNSGASAGEIMKAVREARERDDIKAVVLRVNSPGGTSGASQEIAIELDRLRESGKPIVTSMADLCASGGYWIACSTDHLVANGATITGSIGVIMEVNNLEGLYEKLGIRQETIKSGVHKDMGSPLRDMTQQEEEIFQDMIDDSYQQFLEQVRKGRQEKIAEEKLLEIADGRVFTGRQALELGLVDSLGNYYDAIDQAEEMAGLSDESSIEVLNADNLWERFFLNINTRNIFKNQGLLSLRAILN